MRGSRRWLDSSKTFSKPNAPAAVLTADTLEALAGAMQIPIAAFVADWKEAEKLKTGRRSGSFRSEISCGPVVWSSLSRSQSDRRSFHTRGGPAVDPTGRVKRKNGTGFPNLFAAGGAAAGVSGSTAAGYLSGNGLLTATVLGHLAGAAAARQVTKGLDQSRSGHNPGLKGRDAQSKI